MGRCYKQLYLTTTAPERRADYLRRSPTDYLDVYNEDRQSFWHGINAAALLTRAQRERISARNLRRRSEGTRNSGGGARHGGDAQRSVVASHSVRSLCGTR